jgi:hypothetical protein
MIHDLDINSMYASNLCQEIFLPGQQLSQCTLGLTATYYYSKTHAALNRLPVNKYKFSRAKWYVAEFDWGQQTEVIKWCKQQFGPKPENPDAWSRWCHKSWTEIHFRDEKDYQWFILRWGV